MASIALVVGSAGETCPSRSKGDGNGGGFAETAGARGSSGSACELEGAGGVAGLVSKITSMLRDRTSTNCLPVIYARIAS